MYAGFKLYQKKKSNEEKKKKKEKKSNEEKKNNFYFKIFDCEAHIMKIEIKTGKFG